MHAETDVLVIPDARSAIRNPGANDASLAPGSRAARIDAIRNLWIHFKGPLEPLMPRIDSLVLPKEPPEWLDGIVNPDGFDAPWPPEFGVYFERKFVCECGEGWVDLHDCDCNDRCPACDLEIEPSETCERDALTGAYLYPGNMHVREKMRQQLQVLRDAGFIEFLGRGRYRRRT